MGAYLSQPKTEKVSTEEENDLMVVGASSMQGWRNSQEDAHNAILEFDTNTSLFAVYDGHGGAEVSTYCADKLPQYLKELQSYRDCDFIQALREAFLGFDRTLLDPEVVNVLKILAGEKNLVECPDSDVDEEDAEDLIGLHEESNLPLNEVLERYRGVVPLPSFRRFRDGASCTSGGSKPQSPYLRGRRAAAIIAEAVNKAVMDPDGRPAGSSTSAAAAAGLSGENAGSSDDVGPSTSKVSMSSKMETDAEVDSTVSSSSSRATKLNAKNAENAEGTEAEAEAAAAVAEPKEVTPNGSSSATQATLKSNTPDSSHTKESDQNGSVTSSEVSTSIVKDEKGAPLEDIVSGSNDSTVVEPNDSSIANNKDNNVEQSTISSTSKSAKKLDKSNLEEDSSDDDYQIENNGANESPQALEFSSEDDLDDEDEEDDVDGEEIDGDDEEEDDEDENDDEDEEEDEDDEDGLANDFCANMIEEPGKDSGCTAVVALLHGRDLYVANAGDSRCVLCRNGQAIEMSNDHKPEDADESARINKAGGRVTLDGRVNGGLNLSRAIGDHAYKMNLALRPDQQMISALPDIRKIIITPEDEFMILACDGIWNFMTSEEVVEFVRDRISDESRKMSDICEELFDNCLAPDTQGDGTGCDNMTAIIVRFKSAILHKPTFLNPDETEDIIIGNHASEEDSNEEPTVYVMKRRVVPSNEAENANKRLKTDEGYTPTSANAPTTNANTNNDVAISSSDTTARTSNNTELKECDSGTTDIRIP